jgi:hypothetical protein
MHVFFLFSKLTVKILNMQESEVSAVKYMHCDEYKSCLATENGEYVPYDLKGEYGQLFSIIEKR